MTDTPYFVFFKRVHQCIEIHPTLIIVLYVYSQVAKLETSMGQKLSVCDCRKGNPTKTINTTTNVIPRCPPPNAFPTIPNNDKPISTVVTSVGNHDSRSVTRSSTCTTEPNDTSTRTLVMKPTTADLKEEEEGTLQTQVSTPKSIQSVSTLSPQSTRPTLDDPRTASTRMPDYDYAQSPVKKDPCHSSTAAPSSISISQEDNPDPERSCCSSEASSWNMDTSTCCSLEEDCITSTSTSSSRMDGNEITSSLLVQLPLAAASTALDNDETTTIPVQRTNQHIQEIKDDARPPVLVTTSTLRFTTFDLPPGSIIWNEKSGSSSSTSSGDGSSATTTTSSTHVTIKHSKAIRDEPNSNLSLTLLPEQCHSWMCLKQTLRFVVLDVSSISNAGTH